MSPTPISVRPLEIYAFDWSLTAARYACSNFASPGRIFTIEADGGAEIRCVGRGVSLGHRSESPMRRPMRLGASFT
jgi:hypothetical protein